MRWTRYLAPTGWPLPGGCWICREWGGERLCTACLERFNRPQWRCPRCALPAPTPDTPHCAHCLNDPLPLHAVHTAVDYTAPWDELLQALKHEHALGLVPAFADLLVSTLRREATPLGPVVLLPVPLHPRRLGARGYNQSALLARALGQRLGLPVEEDLLQRVIDTPPQAHLPRRERLRNLRHAFALSGAAPEAHCVLVDDVMTTGATLSTLATLLLQQGATRVDAWVLARTPDPTVA